MVKRLVYIIRFSYAEREEPAVEAAKVASRLKEEGFPYYAHGRHIYYGEDILSIEEASRLLKRWSCVNVCRVYFG
jgi:hypothetical protein